ncbi:hypothetical protein [Haloechinothrix halophila]|uniref:hypothetical protein n=1 Tax=Haloechinothrix halophila TaxID=1069073 RepID=UPI000411D617|nr:hypothetical protein [Haloechinothrix halophila]
MRRPEPDDTHIRRVLPSPPGGRRRRVVPVADLLAREGRPLAVDHDFLFTDALVSVRRGMAGLAAGLLVVVGGASVVGHVLGGDTDDRAGSDDGRSAARERTARPAETSAIGIDVADVASHTRSAARRSAPVGRAAPDTPVPRTTSAAPQPAPAPQPTRQVPRRTSEPSGGGDRSDDYREWSGDYGRQWSGNYGRDWSGDYGTDYWGG